MRPQIRLSGEAAVWLALLILVLPLHWVVAVILAASIHEGFHVLAIILCGGRMSNIRIGQRGASMEVEALTPRQEFFCALAGPAGSLSLVLLANVFPRLAVCGLIHGIYNLLPLYPMDGGRALRCVLIMLFGEKTAEKACFCAAKILCCVVILVGIYVAFTFSLGVLPLIMAGFVIYRVKQRKMPCKERPLAVQ